MEPLGWNRGDPIASPLPSKSSIQEEEGDGDDQAILHEPDA